MKRRMLAKEALILSGRQFGAGVTASSRIVGLSVASTSRRCDAARRKIEDDAQLRRLRDRIVKEYTRNANGES